MGRFNVDTSVFSFVESVLSFSMICWFGSLKAFAHRVRYKQITQYPKMFKSKLVSFIYTPKVLRFAKYLSLHTRGKKRSRPQLVLMFSNKKRKKQILGSSKSQENFMVRFSS